MEEHERNWAESRNRAITDLEQLSDAELRGVIRLTLLQETEHNALPILVGSIWGLAQIKRQEEVTMQEGINRIAGGETMTTQEPTQGITEIEYGFTYNVGNYQSERISARLQVEPGISPEQTFERARQFVEQMHTRSKEVAQLDTQVHRLRNAIDNEAYKLNQMLDRRREEARKYAELRSLLQQHGVDIPELSSYLTPPPVEELPAPTVDLEPDEDDEDDEAEDEDDF